MTSWSRGLRRLSGFAAIPALGVMSPLLAMPILARATTVDEWAAIAVGQSIGGVAGIAVGAGWGVSGVARIAQAHPDERPRILVESLVSRGGMLVLVLPVVLISLALLPDVVDRPLVIATTVAMMTNAFNISWFAVGIGAPRLLASVEAVPRIFGNVAGACLAALCSSILLYPAVLFTLTAIPLAAFHIKTARALVAHRTTPGEVIRLLRHQIPSALVETIAACYSLGASALVAITSATLVVSQFNSGYRLAGFASFGITVVSNTFQGWAASSHGSEFLRRIRIASLAHCALGVAGLILFASLGQTICRLIFGDAFLPPQDAMVLLGVFFLLWSLEAVTSRYVLASRHQLRSLLWTTCTGSAIGVVAIPTLAARSGVVGAAWGLSLSLGVIVTLQAIACVDVLSREVRPE